MSNLRARPLSHFLAWKLSIESIHRGTEATAYRLREQKYRGSNDSRHDVERRVYSISFSDPYITKIVQIGSSLTIIGTWNLPRLLGNVKTQIWPVFLSVVGHEPDRGDCSWRGTRAIDLPPGSRPGMMVQDVTGVPTSMSTSESRSEAVASVAGATGTGGAAWSAMEVVCAGERDRRALRAGRFAGA